MIPPSSTTEVSVDSVEKENEVESTEQPPSPASTTSQESKVHRERDIFFLPFSFFFLTLSLLWKKMCCFGFYFEPCARISRRVLWGTSDCGACSDTPTSEFSLSPGQLRSLNWGNTCLSRGLVWGIFACVFSFLFQ